MLKINGGLCCKPFKAERGIRQGCSMSGMLYSLSIEPMLHNVRGFIDGLFLPDIRRRGCRAVCLCGGSFTSLLFVFVEFCGRASQNGCL